MTRVEREEIASGDVALTVGIRPDLSIDVDADGRVLAIARTADSVRQADVEDVVRVLRYVAPPEPEKPPTCDGCGHQADWLALIVIEVNDGQEMGGRDEYEYCDDCLIERAPVLAAAGSRAELVASDDTPTRETMVTADHGDAIVRVEHAVGIVYPAGHGSTMAGETLVHVHDSRRSAGLQARWHRRNGATAKILTRRWVPTAWEILK